MTPTAIRSRADLAAIEARPYREFMPWLRVDAALEAIAAQHAARPALVHIASADPDLPARCWSWHEFIAEVRRAAALFTALAGAEQPRVALLLPAVPQAYFALWGGQAVGCVCPINPHLGEAHVAALVAASGANIVVAQVGPHDVDSALRPGRLRAACPALKHVLTLGVAGASHDFDALCAAQPDRPLAPPFAPPSAADDAGPQAAAALFHTGGTTGAPRLARLGHSQQLHAARGTAALAAMTADDVTLNAFPVFHVAGPLVYGLSTWLAGGCTLLPPPLGMRDAAFVARYWSFVQRHGVTLLATVPTMIAGLLDVPARAAQTATVRVLYTGGAPLAVDLALRFERRFCIAVRSIFGMTECAGSICVEPALAPRVPGSSGLPLPFSTVGIAGAAVGALRVRGPHVFAGYVDAAERPGGEAAGAFDADGALVTGDLGHVDAEGCVHVTGRAKDLIIRGGHNIDPRLIEEALLAHPAVALAAAVGAPDEYAGELPVAYVTLKPGSDIDVAGLLAFVRQRIADPAACPKRIDIVGALPLTAIGKVYKPALRLRAIERVVAERLAAAGLATAFTAQGVEEAARLSVRFSRANRATSAADMDALQRLMAGFAFTHSVHDPVQHAAVATPP